MSHNQMVAAVDESNKMRRKEPVEGVKDVVIAGIRKRRARGLLRGTSGRALEGAGEIGAEGVEGNKQRFGP